MYDQRPLYTPLNAEKAEIRLLEIVLENEPDDEQNDEQNDELDNDPEPLHCRLHTVSLDENPSFYALSYVWGDPDITTEIIVSTADRNGDNTTPGRSVRVTANLGDALNRVRRIFTARTSMDGGGSSIVTPRIWADALCINQADMQERAAQVQLMRRIYKTAELVMAWLHDEGEPPAKLYDVDDEDMTLGPDEDEDMLPQYIDEDTIEEAYENMNMVTVALDTLETTASEARQCKAADDPDAFFTLEWMRRYPLLSRHHSSHLNLAWHSVQEFIGHSYWTRVWIFQELVLARDLLFMTSEGSLSWDDMELATRCLRNLVERIDQGLAGPPRWMRWPFWASIILASRRLEVLELLSTTRNAGKSDIEGGGQIVAEPDEVDWDMSLIAGLRFNATEPKDLLYGLLGLSKIPIVPDYSIATSVWDVYREYAKQWLDVHGRSSRIRSRFRPLSFLTTAGIGIFYMKPEGAFPDNDDFQPEEDYNPHDFGPDFSSWAPNFPKVMQDTVLSGFGGLADSNMASFGGTTDAYLRNRSLFVYGVQIEPVTSVVQSQEWYDGDLMDYVVDFVSRHPNYVSGIAPLQAFVQLVMPHDLQTRVDRSAILISLSFLYFLDRTQGERFQDFDLLGFCPDPSLELAESFDDWFVQAFFPNTDLDLKALGFEDGLFHVFDQNQRGPIGGVFDTVYMKLETYRREWRYFETASGYLGTAPAGVRPGDIICVLSGCGVPVILRAVNNYFVHIGTATIAGLMDGEAAELVKKRHLVVKRFEIR